MWSNRGNFPIHRVPDYKRSACVETPFFLKQQSDSTEREHLSFDVDDFNYISSLDYTLVPTLSCEDAHVLLAWVLHRWLPERQHFPSEAEFTRTLGHTLQCLIEDEETIAAFTQVEYFFIGTDNGHLFAVPLLPMHFLRVLVERHGSQFPGLVSELKPVALEKHKPEHIPVHCCAKRLLHRHAREELIRNLDHKGTIVASTSTDKAVALSFFHPLPTALVCIPHPKAVRCLKLWEGGVFVDRMEPSNQPTRNVLRSDEAATSVWETWRRSLGEEERAAIYVFTGDDVTTVRLWRVDVLQKRYALLHVFVASPNRTGLHSSLSMVNRDDSSKHSTTCESGTPIYSLALDSDSRLLAGTDSGFFAWSIDKLSWKPLCGAEDHAAEDDAEPQIASTHPLCWCESTCTPFVPLLPSEQQHAIHSITANAKDQDAVSLGASKDDYAKVRQVVRSRASRLANHHVWLCEADYLKRHLSPRDPSQPPQPKGRLSSLSKKTDSVVCRNGVPLSKWKPKHALRVAGGKAVGIVCNEVALPVDYETNTGVEPLGFFLHNSVVTVRFDEGGELGKDLRVPLCCVEPVVYPLCFMKMACIGCFALLILQEGNLLVSSGSDGKCMVWVWKTEMETYIPMLISDSKGPQSHLGRHLCRLHKPDVFMTCGYDDGLVKEWHLYDEPELLLRSERHFTLEKAPAVGWEGGPYHEKQNSQETNERESGWCQRREKMDFCEGIACAISFEPFGALFLVGIFESTIRSFSLIKVLSCEAPQDYVYNGHKTVKVPNLLNWNSFH
ncbi:unnamed protein product [Phytomonas sp. Hart1]|nr:unnamed protein product [Phytomonas sp. Hart1]|eukprot:CCW70240.1 unnamed protein product [Phytomonas sp. isolate Hart1]